MCCFYRHGDKIHFDLVQWGGNGERNINCFGVLFFISSSCDTKSRTIEDNIKIIKIIKIIKSPKSYYYHMNSF